MFFFVLEECVFLVKRNQLKQLLFSVLNISKISNVFGLYLN